MTIEILVCRSDGTQAVELRELPDNWFVSEPEETAESETEE